MAIDFSQLKKKSQSAAQNLEAMLTKMESKSYSVDDRFWSPTRDKAGNAQAVIRFLPEPAGDDEDFAFVQVFKHEFREGGRLFLEDCLTTIGEKCPVCEKNTELWNASSDENDPLKNIARARKRKSYYVANILVIEDKQKPENNGKVFLFKFKKQIFDKIQEMIRPAFEDDPKVNVFDLNHGAHFRLNVTMKGEWATYETSKFASPSALFDGDEAKQEAVWRQEHSLAFFKKADGYKSYDDLKGKFVWVTGDSVAAPTQELPAEAVSAKPSFKQPRVVEKLPEQAESLGDTLDSGSMTDEELLRMLEED